MPLLRIASDKREHTASEAMATIAAQLNLSPEDQDDLLPSGTQTRFFNRVSWAITYLTKSGLLKRSGRGRFEITPRGLEVLTKNPSRIDNAFLDQFPKYRLFKTKRAALAVETQRSSQEVLEVEPTVTPDERLDAAYRELREALADELLERVRAGTPKFFEHLVIDLLVGMGYGGSRADAAQVVGKSGDEGIDGVIKEDRLGLDMVYVQAKKWDSAIGPAEIDRFVGSLMRKKAHKGVFITTGTFTSGALRAAQEASSKIVLIDGELLAELMIDHGVAVTDHKAYVVKRIDSDYFETQ